MIYMKYIKKSVDLFEDNRINSNLNSFSIKKKLNKIQFLRKVFSIFFFEYAFKSYITRLNIDNRMKR